MFPFHKEMSQGRKFDPVTFLLNSRPSYYGPNWSGFYIVLLRDNEDILIGQLLGGRFFSSYQETILKELEKMNYSNISIDKIGSKN